MSPSRPFLCLATLLLLILAAPLAAQTTFATITGNVTDPNGLVVPGAAIELVQVETNYRYTARSNETGTYTLAQLRQGSYMLQAKAGGFKEFAARDIQLAAREVRRIDVRLEIGAVESRVEVTAGAALIETETARITDTRGADALRSLPTNSRSVFSFLQLTPTVFWGNNTDIRFAGSRRNQENEAIDGITIGNLYDGTVITSLADFVESVEEVRIDAANNGAEFGAIGQMTMISKSGTNQVHGSAFDYYSAGGLASRNPFAVTKGSYTTHAPGFSFGGPVFLPHIYDGRNRTFFFGSYETMRGSAIQQLLNPSVPLATWRAGNFADLLPKTVIRDPFADNAPFPGNIIPAPRLNPVSIKYQDRFYPLPNYGNTSVFSSQNYRETKTRAYDPNTYWTTRLDHRFSEKATVFGRYSSQLQWIRPYESNLPTVGQRWQQRVTRSLNVTYTHTIHANLLNEFRSGIAFNNQPRYGPVNGKQLIDDLGLVGLAPDIPDVPGILSVGFSGVGLQKVSQQPIRVPGFRNMVYQFNEQLSWFRGKHTIKAGGTLNHVSMSDPSAANNLFGTLTFANTFTGHAYADFMLGIPTTAARAFPQVVFSLQRWEYNLFVSDDYKLSPKLTLNMGLRYEYKPPWGEANGLIGMFDVESGNIVVPDGSLSKVSPLMPKNYVGVVEAKTLGFNSSTILKPDGNNFAPRIGLAWRPWTDRTVLRAGFGMFYDVVPRDLDYGTPFTISEPNYTNPSNNPDVIFPRVFPLTLGGPSTVYLPYPMRIDLRVPYSFQYNFTIERQQWEHGFRLSYIGTSTREGEYAYNVNQPLPSTTPFVDKARMFPRYPDILYLTNGAGHQYNSLTAEVKRRMSHGLTYQLSWVWARDIGDLERGESPENAYDRARERSVWPDIPTHRITGNMIYELPVGKGRKWMSGTSRWVNGILGGWELSAIFTRQTGMFLTPTWSGPDPTGTAYTASRTPAQVTIRPNQLSNGNLPSGQQSVDRWFDASAFGAPTAGSFGSSAKGVVIGPGMTVLHGGLAKYFPIRERMKLRGEITATNLPNHPNWSNPGMNITSSGSVGVISGTGGNSSYDQPGVRFFRIGARLEW